MAIKRPSDFHPGLKDEYLTQVANWLLEEWYATEDDLIRETDTSYTRGTTRFGRQLQRIVNEYLSGQHDWLGIENGSLDLVFSISGIPCRFSNDSLEAPTKRAVLQVHPYQMSLIEDAQPGQAVRFCFVIDQGFGEIIEPRAELLGFTASGNLACRWQSGTLDRTLIDIKAPRPEAVEVTKPMVTPKRRDYDVGDDIDTSAGQ
ncbi:hypothetical protein [Lysobacter antibioticus]|uniref:hypothetical protein n=1 Tax=Lysobacter antibioticus TaxID=84531 RepID=UPI00118770FB|nr:hypothetical protein [Lysobacter antibioticus]